MKNFREIEQLSAYLDGQLNAADAAKMESRIQSDPELASAIKDLRAARGLLRKLPARKAPRNFTLTRQMVGLKPPLPRTYPLFRLATVFATILFVLSFSVNALSPYFTVGLSGAAAPAPAYGMGGGGGCDTCSSEAATEAPAATEEAPMMQMAPAATQEAVPLETETAKVIEPTPATKLAPESTAQDQTQATENQAAVQNEASASFTWTVIFFILALLSGLGMIVMRQSAARKWR